MCLVTFHDFPEGQKGGEERFLETFCTFLTEKKVTVTVVSSASKRSGQIFGVGIRRFRVPFLGLTPYLLFFSFMSVLKIVKLNKEYVFSLIHSTDTGYGGLAGLAASKILNLPFVVHSHCSRSKLLKATILLHPGHEKLVASIYQNFEATIDKLVTRNANKIITVNNEIKEYVNSLGVINDKIIVIPMGIDSTNFCPECNSRDEVFKEFRIPNNAFVVGFVGSLIRAKGVFSLVQAFSLFKNCSNDSYLLLVGDGENIAELKDFITIKKIDSIILTGYRKDIAKLLAAMNIFVFLSISEGCPFSLLEAMAAGKPIIASNIPSIRELVQNGKEGLLVDPKNNGAVADLLSKLYSDKNLRGEIGMNAIKKAHLFQREKGFEKILSIYPGNIQYQFFS